MAIQKCHDCGGMVSSEANACPACGAPVKKAPIEKRQNHISTFAGLVIIVGVVTWGVMCDSPSRPVITHEKEEIHPDAAPAIRLPAVNLFSDYAANEVSADQQYKGKLVEVSGAIRKIGKDFTGSPFIIIGGDDLNGVQCMFPRSDDSPVAQVREGQNVTVRGRVSGKILGSVLLGESKFQ